MLHAVRLVNLRSLEDTGEIELRPLTILVGANSSGKSSFLRFFPLLRQTEREESGSPLLFFGADVDFGEYKDARRAGAEGPIGVGLTFRLDDREVKVLVEVSHDEEVGSYVSRFKLHGYSVLLDNFGEPTLLSMNGRDVPLPIWRGERMNPRALIPTFIGDEDGVLFRAKAMSGQLVAEYSVSHEIVALILKASWDLHDCERTLREVARNVRYIGPFRATPERFYRRKESAVDRVSKTGDNLAFILNALSRIHRAYLSAWIREHFGFSLNLETDGSQLVVTIEENGARTNLVDTGFGLSQVLPVVVQSWLAAQPSPPIPDRLRGTHEPAAEIFAIEQPELHLHPRYQAHLADMFAGLVRAHNDLGRRLPTIVETHSEALVNRLGELVAEGKLDPADVQVLVFERNESGSSTVRRSEFDEQGVLQNWPIGFFLA